MTDSQKFDNLFFNNMDESRVCSIISDALSGMDDGELFLEFCQSENLTFDDGHLKNASFDTSHGMGLRAILGEASGYAHSSDLSEMALIRAAEVVRAVGAGHNGTEEINTFNSASNTALYTDINPLNEVTFNRKVELLSEINAYLREKDNRVKQVSISLSGEWQAVQIIRADGAKAYDIRPLVRLNISVVVEKNGRMENGSYGCGGRASYDKYISDVNWKFASDEALRQALVNLESVDTSAGEMDVVLGSGWPGVLLHEAVGHGLEADHTRKGLSNFSGLMGERIASKGVTIVDNGTMEGRRGSITIDDEGTKSECNTLVEDGILVKYMHDRLSARLTGVSPTGNGRRESYEHQPIPRMTNTYMLNGNDCKEDMISSVKNGLYAVNFGGGQVDITSGKFVFSASEAYKIENGKITSPVKGATLIGNGSDVLKRIKAIGNDLELDHGIGTCGKDGQGVPVGVGQPTLLINNITVGGTEV